MPIAHRISFFSAVALLSVAATGCGSSDLSASTSGQGADTAESSSSSAAADTSCRIVTRSAGESTLNGAPWEISTDSNGTQWLVWRGSVDVDAADATNSDGSAASVFVTWSHNVESNAGQWFTTQATPTGDASSGFQSYTFALDHDTYGAGDDGYEYGKLDIQFIPYLVLADGTHLYDHNRTSGNYNMDSQFDWRVDNDPNTCPASASAPAPAPAADAGSSAPPSGDDDGSGN